MTILTINKKHEFDELYKASAFTVTGAGGDLQDWFDGLNEMFAEKEIGEVLTMFTFKGKDMNETYNLTGDNAYPEDTTFLSFKLNGLDVGKLAMIKLQMEARWFDDIVDNNANREQSTMVH